jgi:hypothetical protein
MPDRLAGCLRGIESLVAIAVMLVAAGPVAGQTGESRNAATWYQRSFDRLGSIEITEAEWKVIREYQRDPHAAPSATVRAVLARVEPVLSAARSGARQEYNDFGLDYTQGIELMLPHLGKLRNIGRLMAADAAVRLHDGDASGAADQIASVYRIADHLPADEILISSLVGQAVFQSADRVAQMGLDRGDFGPTESSTLRDALQTLGERDPFDLTGAMENEGVIMTDWVRQKYGDAEVRAHMMDDLSMELGASGQLAALMLVEDSQFEGALDQYGQVMDRVVDAFSMDDPDEARLMLEQIGGEIERGEHGALAMLMSPATARLYDRMLEAQEQIAERTDQLSAIIAGRVAPGELANAAVLYLQAVELIGQIDPARLEQLYEAAGKPLQPIGPEPAETLRTAAGIVETLGRAAEIPRCDFSIVHGRYAPVIPRYLAGLRQAGRLLAADAVRLLQEAQDDQAARRLEVCFRMSAHLAGDPIITSALVSHNVFNGADELARWALGNDAFSADDRARLFRGVEAMPRKDPFGYVAAVRNAREQVLKRVRFSSDARSRAEQELNRCDGDQLLYLLVVVSEPADPGEKEPDEAAGLDGVITPEGLAAARGRAEEARGVLKETEDLGAVLDRDVGLIGNVKQRQATARADLRRTYFALQAPES